QARAGDAHAFEAILRPMIQPAYRLALAMLGKREAAEDAVQEMALKAWRYRGRLRPELGSPLVPRHRRQRVPDGPSPAVVERHPPGIGAGSTGCRGRRRRTAGPAGRDRS